MSPTVLDGIDEVLGAGGRELGVSRWLELTAEREALFASVVGPGAGELLVLSLSNHFLPQLLEVRGVAMGINYGVDRVRFPAPAVTGDRLRASATVVAAQPIAGGAQTTIRIVIEVEGRAEPVCEIDSISRWMV